jgi:hypothetical protein
MVVLLIVVGLLAVLAVLTVVARRRERERIQRLLESGAAGELLAVDIGGHERSNMAIAEASAHAQMRSRR